MNGGGALSRFSETAPRPPVFPGEENVQSYVKMEPWASRFHSRRGPSLPIGALSPSKGSSPVPTPRRHPTDESDLARRYEAAEGSASTSPPLAETPPYLRWAENLHFLLADPDGVELFEKFLEQENCSHLLKFWFACEGLKRQWTDDPEKAVQIIHLIHRKYIRPRKINVSELIRREVNDRVANKSTLDVHIFDAAQKEVEDLMRDSVYANFLNSDVYLSYIQSMQNVLPDSPRSGRSQAGSAEGTGKISVDVLPVSSSSGESVGSGGGGGSASGIGERSSSILGPLPTLHEDAELSYQPTDAVKPIPLTLKALMATEEKRMNVEVRPPSGPYSGSRVVHHPYHLPTYYAPYNPVSRQDSEISSDALTDDTRSLTDSSVDGSMLFFPIKPSRHQQRKAQLKIRRDAMQNRDHSVHQTFIPRTQRVPKEQMMPQQPNEFAALLIQKLEAVKRERESEEKLLRIVAERDGDTSGVDESFVSGPSGGRGGSRQGSECPARVLAEALSKIAPSNESDTQSILDNHVQRIWSDQTPLRSPGAPSPRPWSPENRRRMPTINPSKASVAPSAGSSYSTGSSSYFQRSSAHHRRKDKDMEKGSTFSADSGAILDMGDGGKERHFGRSGSGVIGAGVAGKKGGDFGDSGLCLLADASASSLMAPPPVPSKEKVLHWITNNDKWQEGDRDSSTKHRSRPGSSTSPLSSRRSRKQVTTYGTSRSESLERSGPSAAPSIPHDIIVDDSLRNRPPTKPKPSLQPHVPVAASQSSTLKKPFNTSTVLSGEGGPSSSAASIECTVVTFTFGDEPVPYRSKIPGRTVTLKQFKDILPKKGNYKYYFKTNCEDDVALAVNQEVIDDLEVLPLWEDKVLGIVKLID